MIEDRCNGQEIDHTAAGLLNALSDEAVKVSDKVCLVIYYSLELVLYQAAPDPAPWLVSTSGG